MPIIVNEKDKVFHLQTAKTSYIFGFLTSNTPVHMYWGKRLEKTPDINTLFIIPYKWPRSFCVVDGTTKDGDIFSRESLTMEFSTFGSSDLREPTFHAEYKDGSTVSDFEYKSYKITNGKKGIEGLPATYSENDSEAQTLEVTLTDKLTGLDIILQYGVFDKLNAITRSIRCENHGKNRAVIDRILSASVDFKTDKFDMIHLPGTWGRERVVTRVPVTKGYINVSSARGASSNTHNPFIALVSKDATENFGSAYGFSLVYSGNFLAGTYADYLNCTRAYIGINPFGFKWQLDPGDTFSTPEAVLVYSGEGIGEMSRIYHRLYRTRLCRGEYRDKERSCLINNWEATYFDFDEEKIVEIAKKAASCGIKLMVLDDGWFGKRDNDRSSLGDWFVDKRKLPNGIDGLCKKINALGMKFGLWFEPEMISPVSELYAKHPDWCIHVDGRDRKEGRNQLILDLSRDEVCDYIINSVNAVLDSANIEYVKWDMNRNMACVGSATLPSDRQGELYHRYMLGLYRVLEAIVSSHPHILFESCSGGGGRFDPGMLHYMPQTWTSDNTDALARIDIQYGTSICYPYSSMGAHVSAVPNHQVRRTTPISFRGNVAIPGQFGYELDLTKLSDEDIAEIKEQTKFYEKYGEVFHRGDLYRLRNPLGDYMSAIEFVSEDKNTVIVMLYSHKGTANAVLDYVCLGGLDAGAEYKKTENGEIWTGEALMNVGIPFMADTDYKSRIWIFEKI